MVSIIIPTYNRAYCIKESIDSVLRQTYEDFELLIVDDGSSDNTGEVIASYSDERIRYIKKENGGAADARNHGILSARGEYIAFQDSDDLWHEDKLEKQVRLMEETPGTDLIYHSVRYTIDGAGEVILPSKDVPLERKSGDIYAELLHENLVDCPSVLVKKSAVDSFGMFDTQLKALEDYDFALNLCKNGVKAGFLNEVLLEKTLSTESVSQNPKNYLISSCIILGKYLNDYISTGNFDYRVLRIYEDAKKVGLDEQIMSFLEQVIKLNK